MRIRSVLGFSVVAAAMLASSAAMATPTFTVAGISFFNGPVQINQNDEETLIIPGVQNILQGVGFVTNMTDGSPFNVSWTQGNNSRWLYDEFTGFTVDMAHTGPVGTDFKIALMGGQLSYYYFTSDQTAAIQAAANISAAAAIAAVKAGTLWLDLVPQADANGDTFVITLPSGAPGDVTLGSGKGFADITGLGAADAAFKACKIAFANGGAPCPSGFTNFSFVGGSSPNPNVAAFPVSGTDHLNAITVPEPMTVSLFGAGLMGAVMVRRRKSKKA
jgi:hypothetical protein